MMVDDTTAMIRPKIKINDYKELYLIAWSIDRDNLEISEHEAFGLYQANWRFVCVDRMDYREWFLLIMLVEKYGPIASEFMDKAGIPITLDDLKVLRANLDD